RGLRAVQAGARARGRLQPLRRRAKRQSGPCPTGADGPGPARERGPSGRLRWPAALTVPGASTPDRPASVAIVTGASRGIGRAIAERLAASGTAVALGGRDVALLDEVADAIGRSGGRAMAAPADLGSEDAIERMVRLVIERLGPPD